MWIKIVESKKKKFYKFKMIQYEYKLNGYIIFYLSNFLSKIVANP